MEGRSRFVEIRLAAAGRAKTKMRENRSNRHRDHGHFTRGRLSLVAESRGRPGRRPFSKHHSRISSSVPPCFTRSHKSRWCTRRKLQHALSEVRGAPKFL